MTECIHEYEYRGRYGKVGYQLPGSGAHSVDVFDVYFCRKCLNEVRRDTGLENYTTYGGKPWEGEYIT